MVLKNGSANEEESDSKEYEVTPPKNRSRRQNKVGSRSAERKRHKPLSELTSGQGHSLHSDGAMSPAKRPMRHARSAPERNERRAQSWLREHPVAEELAGPSRSVSHMEQPQVGGKSRRQRNSKLHDMPWESETPSKGVVHGRQGLRSDGIQSERPLRIKLKCVENTTKREEEEVVPEENDYRRGKQSRMSARTSQRQNHVQKEKAKVVEVKVGVTHSIPRGGLRAPRQSLRKIESAAWLLTSEVEQGHYTPQFGDEVAYVQQVCMTFVCTLSVLHML